MGTRFEEHWVERLPHPLVMTPKEQIAFLDEHEVLVSWKESSEFFPRIVTLTSDAFETTKGFTLEQAIFLAAAKFAEANS